MKSQTAYKTKLFWTIGIAITIFLGLVLLVFEWGRGIITNTGFLFTYLGVFVVGTLFSIFNIFYLISRKESLFASDGVIPDFRWKYAVWIFIIIFVIVVITVGGKSIVPTGPSPYSASGLSVESLSQHTGFENLKNVAFYPMMEEVVVLALAYILLTVFQWITFWITKSKMAFGGGFFVFHALLAVGITSFFFASAHGLSYGEDQSAYLSAFSFEFVVQSANLFTGLFLSWIPHFLNNALVVFNLAVGLVIGGQLSILPILSRWNK